MIFICKAIPLSTNIFVATIFNHSITGMFHLVWIGRRSCWRACRFGVGSQFSESILERWYIARVSQRNVVVLEFWSPCLPRSPSSVHDSRHEQQWISPFFPILLHPATLSVLASWYTWESSCTAAVSVTSRPVLSWVFSTLRLLLSSDERVWFTSVSTSRPVLSEELSSSFKRINIDLWRTGRVSSIFHFTQVAPICHELDLELVGLVGRILLVEQLLLLVVEQLPFLVVEQLHLLVVDQHSNPILLSIRALVRSLAEGRDDMYTFSYKTSPVFQSNNFWNTKSWEYSVKDDCIRSSLIECQCFPNCEIDVDPIIPASWCLFHALCRYCARRGTYKSILSRSLWLLSLGSTSSKNTVCLLLEFWPPGINPELMTEWRLNAHPIW